MSLVTDKNLLGHKTLKQVLMDAILFCCKEYEN